MTINQYIEKQRRILLNQKFYVNPFRQAVFNIVARQGERIFLDGENSKGDPIGQYNDSTPLYVNPKKKSPKQFTPAGNPENSRNVKNRKTKWFPSYKAFRDEIGRQTKFVDLVLSGDLQLDFNNSSPRKISDTKYVTELKRKKNQEKRSGMEDKYGTIFNLTKKERSDYYKTLSFNLNAALAKL